MWVSTSPPQVNRPSASYDGPEAGRPGCTATIFPPATPISTGGASGSPARRALRTIRSISPGPIVSGYDGSGPHLRQRLGHRSAACAEPDGCVAGAMRVAKEADLVAVFQVGPRLAIRQRERIASTAGHLQQASRRAVRRPRHGAAAEQVAGLQIASIRAVVCHHLGDGPDQIAGFGA